MFIERVGETIIESQATFAHCLCYDRPFFLRLSDSDICETVSGSIYLYLYSRQTLILHFTHSVPDSRPKTAGFGKADPGSLYQTAFLLDVIFLLLRTVRLEQQSAQV